jgi:hypothetical protein
MYDLRHGGGVAVVELRHGVAVLLKIYAHCIDGQADAANQRITDALGTKDTQPEPGARKTATVKWHLERGRSKASKARIGA